MKMHLHMQIRIIMTIPVFIFSINVRSITLCSNCIFEKRKKNQWKIFNALKSSSWSWSAFECVDTFRKIKSSSHSIEKITGALELNWTEQNTLKSKCKMHIAPKCTIVLFAPLRQRQRRRRQRRRRRFADHFGTRSARVGPNSSFESNIHQRVAYQKSFYASLYCLKN